MCINVCPPSTNRAASFRIRRLNQYIADGRHEAHDTECPVAYSCACLRTFVLNEGDRIICMSVGSYAWPVAAVTLGLWKLAITECASGSRETEGHEISSKVRQFQPALVSGCNKPWEYRSSQLPVEKPELFNNVFPAAQVTIPVFS